MNETMITNAMLLLKVAYYGGQVIKVIVDIVITYKKYKKQKQMLIDKNYKKSYFVCRKNTENYKKI